MKSLLRKMVIFSLAATALLVPTGSNSAILTPMPKLVLTSVENGLTPESSFSCQNVIHGYLTMPNPMVGKNILEADWIAPNGVIKESARAVLEFVAPGRRTAYIWAK